MHIIIKYTIQNQQYIIKRHYDDKHKTLFEKFMPKICFLIPDMILEIIYWEVLVNCAVDETMLNYKCKSHIGYLL